MPERMQTIDRFHSEELELLSPNPQNLMEQNLAALIVNEATYNRMLQHFSPLMADPIQIARVRIHTDSGVETRWLIVDGMTRAKFAADRGWDRINAKDVTEELLRNPLVNKEGEQASGLTIPQYLRAVIPPTIVHQEIAPERVATHIINGWKSIVGERIAAKVSGFAALTYLQEKGKLLTEVDSEDYKRLQTALDTVQIIIAESELELKEVLASALRLIATDYQALGGKHKAREQVELLLGLKVFDQKLREETPDISTREAKRLEIARLLFGKIREINQIGQYEMFLQLFNDYALSIDEIIEILSSGKGTKEAYRVMMRNRKEAITKSCYLKHIKRDELTPTELKFLFLLAKEVDRSSADEIVRTVASINQFETEYYQLQTYLADNRDRLIYQGVSAEYIEEGAASLRRTYDSLNSKVVLRSITEALDVAQTTLRDLQENIQTQIRVNTATRAAVQVFRNARPEVVQYLSTLVGADNPEVVEKVAQQLQSLGSDLRREVTLHITSLSDALMKQDSGVSTTPEADHSELIKFEAALRDISTLLDLARIETVDFGSLSPPMQQRLNHIINQLGQARFSHPDVVGLLSKIKIVSPYGVSNETYFCTHWDTCQQMGCQLESALEIGTKLPKDWDAPENLLSKYPGYGQCPFRQKLKERFNH